MRRFHPAQIILLELYNSGLTRGSRNSYWRRRLKSSVAVTVPYENSGLVLIGDGDGLRRAGGANSLRSKGQMRWTQYHSKTLRDQIDAFGTGWIATGDGERWGGNLTRKA